jgi:hypothetical protein
MDDPLPIPEPPQIPVSVAAELAGEAKAAAQSRRSRFAAMRAPVATFVGVFAIAMGALIFFGALTPTPKTTPTQILSVPDVTEEVPATYPMMAPLNLGPREAEASGLSGEPVGSAPALDGPDLVQAIQQRLAELGFDPGSVDGIFGSSTKQAIVDYQRQAELAPTGEPSVALLMHMQGAAAN